MLIKGQISIFASVATSRRWQSDSPEVSFSRKAEYVMSLSCTCDMPTFSAQGVPTTQQQMDICGAWRHNLF